MQKRIKLKPTGFCERESCIKSLWYWRHVESRGVKNLLSVFKVYLEPLVSKATVFLPVCLAIYLISQINTVISSKSSKYNLIGKPVNSTSEDEEQNVHLIYLNWNTTQRND